MNETILQVVDLSVKFDDENVISKLNFSVKKGETLAIIGPNGAGKSVLFRALLNLIPYKGFVEWAENIKIGYVPQKLSIEKDLPLSVMEFFQFKGDKKEISESIKLTGIKNKDVLNKKLGTLSGGEFQRIMIAWAIMDKPDVLLFDEPLAGIDIEGEETIYDLLHRLGKDKGSTILLISHDLNIVYKYSNDVLCLNKKQLCFGKPKDIINTENLIKLYGEMAAIHEHDYGHHH